ncbi:MAG: C45 family peptidase, partial [Saprospiraceae bacterium]
LEEVRGIAVGSGQDFKDVFAFQLVDEYWVYQDKLRNDGLYHHCSSIGVPAMNSRPAYVSQNLDIDAWMDGYQIIVHIRPDGNTPEQYLLSCAGVVALNGFNEHGIGVCVNTLMQLNASTDGLPVAFMLRGILEQKKGSDALHFLQNTKHASGQNYILGTVDSVYDFEASSGKVLRMYPDASGLVFHTNNPVVNDNIKPWYKNYFNRFLAGNTKNGNSEIRFATLKRRAAASNDKDDSFIKTTLRSKDDLNNPVCRTHLPNKGGFTFGSVIYTLSSTRSMQVTAGPPDESEYQTFSFGK